MTDGQSANLYRCQDPIWGPRPDFYHCQCEAGLLMWDALSNERMHLSFTTDAGPRQHILGSESRGTHDHILLCLRLPQPGGPGPHIYIPQEQDSPVIPLGTGFPSRHLIQLAGLQ
jgi:hypothetical protein